MNFHYYADLNPRYGQRYQRRYAVFLRKSETQTSQTDLHYVARKSAERAAERLNMHENEPASDPD